MNFAERLKTLPAVNHLAALQLLDPSGQTVANSVIAPVSDAGTVCFYV